MKKKIISLCLVLCLAATAVIGGTLAYFTDNEAAKNQFVVGDIDIVLNEDFDDEAPLVPTNDYKNNSVKKVVDITNKGESDAYVRLLIAYEDTKDVGAMAYLGFNDPYCPNGPIKQDKEDAYVIPGGNGDWLQITDGTTVYTVGYVTLSKKLAPEANSGAILNALAIKAGADNAWAEIVGDKYDVLVLAQGAQVVDGKGATESINTSFGFTMNAQADAQVAKLFTDAGLGTFSAHTYTAEGAWSAKTAWDAVVNDGTPSPDEVGTITDSND